MIIRKIGFILFLFSFLIFNSCKIKELFTQKEEPKKEVEKSFDIKMPVTVSAAVSDTLVKYIKTNGKAEAYQKTQIFTERSGTIETINIQNNQNIPEGELILSLDKDDILLDIKRTKLNLKKAKKEYEAWKKLGENTNDEQLQLRTGLIEHQISLEKLRLDIDKTEIRAPFSGFVSDLETSKGEKISAGSNVCSIFNLERVRVKADILESEINRVSLNNKAIILFPAIPNEIYSGKIKSISPYIDEESSTCEIEIIIPNDGKIKDGMFAEVKVAAEKYPNRIIIHKDALLVRDGKKLVFAVEKGKAKWQYVKTGERNDKFIAIKHGVKANQKIVIENNFSLSHDANAKIEKEIPYEEFKKSF